MDESLDICSHHAKDETWIRYRYQREMMIGQEGLTIPQAWGCASASLSETRAGLRLGGGGERSRCKLNVF